MYQPRCIQNRTDCFAISVFGHCSALDNTEFDKKCPFYKSKEQFDKEQKEAEKWRKGCGLNK